MNEDFLLSVGYPDAWDTISMLTQDHPEIVVDAGTVGTYDNIEVIADRSGVNVVFCYRFDGDYGDGIAVYGKGRTSVDARELRPGLVELDVWVSRDTTVPLIVMVDDTFQYPSIESEAVREFPEYWMGAIAEEVEVFPTQRAWRDAQEPLLTKEQASERLGGTASGDIYMPPRFVFGHWVPEWKQGQADVEDLTSHATLTAVCSNVKKVRNGVTGVEWYRVEADCGFPIAVALPATITPVPKPGSVIEGTVLLTGTTRYW